MRQPITRRDSAGTAAAIKMEVDAEMARGDCADSDKVRWLRAQRLKKLKHWAKAAGVVGYSSSNKEALVSEAAAHYRITRTLSTP